MKLAIWLFFLMTITLPSQAQREPGYWQLGAEVNQINYQKFGTDPAAYTVLFTPSIGYLLGKNLAVILGIPMGINSASDGSTNFEQTQIRIGLSTGIRYYLSQYKLKPFLGFSYNYLLNRNTYTVINQQYSVNDNSSLLIPSAGLTYNLTEKLVLTANLNYLININESNTLFATGVKNNLEVDRPNYKALSLGLGIQFRLGK